METNWLSELEHKVERVTGELEEARKESRSLKSRMQRLRRELAEARTRDSAERGLTEEREEVRRRVGELVERLEALL